MSKRVLNLQAVQNKVPKSRSAIYQMMKDGTFPKSIKLSERSIGWLESDIDKWIEQKVSANTKEA